MKIPIRSEIEILPADDPRSKTIGWTMGEVIGVAAYNPRCLTFFGRLKVRLRTWFAELLHGKRPPTYL